MDKNCSDIFSNKYTTSKDVKSKNNYKSYYLWFTFEKQGLTFHFDHLDILSSLSVKSHPFILISFLNFHLACLHLSILFYLNSPVIYYCCHSLLRIIGLRSSKATESTTQAYNGLVHNDMSE